MSKFKYKYAKATKRNISIEQHFRNKYIDQPNICKYVDLGLPKGAPDGYYLHRKAKYQHIKYICINGLCTKTSMYWNNDDPFRPQPIHIFMLDKKMRDSLIECYNYLTDQMKYEVRFYVDRENIRRDIEVAMLLLKNGEGYF